MFMCLCCRGHFLLGYLVSKYLKIGLIKFLKRVRREMINKAGEIFLIEAQREREPAAAAARLENRMQDKADVLKLPEGQN